MSSDRYLEKVIEKRSKVTKILDERSAPMVGIFWMHPKTNQIISPYPEALEHAQHHPEDKVTDTSVTHHTLWPLVKDNHPDLKHLKYDEVPRARVFYNHETSKFHVWGPEKHLADPEIHKQIYKTFNLSPKKVVFEPKQDYEKDRGGSDWEK
jgi:hypothetical protein